MSQPKETEMMELYGQLLFAVQESIKGESDPGILDALADDLRYQGTEAKKQSRRIKRAMRLE